MLKKLNQTTDEKTTNYQLTIGSHYENLMNVTGGFNAGELIVIAARPGCGKTTLSLNLAADFEVPVLFESLEMTDGELKNRLAQFLKPDYLKKMKLFINDNPEADVDSIEADIRKSKAKVVFIDYLQIMHDNIKTATMRLKCLAKKYKVVIVLLAQLNRKAHDNIPTLAMLKDSGNIEQDADQVWFITENELMIAKNRKGACANIPIWFNKPCFCINEDLETIEHNTKLMDMIQEMHKSESLIHFAIWSHKIKKFDWGFWYRHIKNQEVMPMLFVAHFNK